MSVPVIQFMDGREFKAVRPSTGLWRKMLKFMGDNVDITTEEGFDEAQDLIVKAFGKQFTAEELEADDGLPLEDWIPTLNEVAQYINEVVSKKSKEKKSGKNK